MVDWSKWGLILLIILAFTSAILVNAEQNRQENCYEKCCIGITEKIFCATNCQNYPNICDQNSEGKQNG